MAPKINTVISYLLPLLAVYFLVYIPLFRQSPNPIDNDNDNSSPHECTPESFAHVRNRTISLHPNPDCPPHSYTTHILHRDPLIIYIPHFLSATETSHLVSLALPNFTASTIYDGSTTKIDPLIRKSEVALLPDDDATVQCVAARALAFQGWPANVYVEKFRAQRYGVGGHYANHYDWTGASRRADRVSTFMVYLEATGEGGEGEKGGLEGGGTNFPRIARPRPLSTEWCEFVECGGEEGAGKVLVGGEGEGGVDGLTFKAVKGSAVYWENLRPKSAGRGGYEETWHAGLPVRRGTKIGLNVWSWLQDC